jgi:hypothetical protein
MAQAIQGHSVTTWDALSVEDRKKMVAALQALAAAVAKTIV